ncbi:hypothetical protein TNCV_4162121 [Trichonephila clavipes]|nr:hypothetical protein TNCV_4162121 [Trichonephila clavipes]
MLGNEIVSALIDTGSTVSLIREDVSSKIVDHSRQSKINTVLYGLGQTEKGSFEYDFVLDKDQRGMWCQPNSSVLKPLWVQTIWDKLL